MFSLFSLSLSFAKLLFLPDRPLCVHYPTYTGRASCTGVWKVWQKSFIILRYSEQIRLWGSKASTGPWAQRLFDLSQTCFMSFFLSVSLSLCLSLFFRYSSPWRFPAELGWGQCPVKWSRACASVGVQMKWSAVWQLAGILTAPAPVWIRGEESRQRERGREVVCVCVCSTLKHGTRTNRGPSLVVKGSLANFCEFVLQTFKQLVSFNWIRNYLLILLHLYFTTWSGPWHPGVAFYMLKNLGTYWW